MSPGVRNLWIGFIGGLVLLGVLGVGVVAILLDREVARARAEEEKKGTPAAKRDNAKCILCGRRFSIPEEHRGTVAEWTREYRCPNCGIPNAAGSFYQWAEEKPDGK